MNTYTAQVEVAAKIRSGDHVDELMDQLEKFHGTVGETARGFAFGLISLPATSLEAAAATAVAIVGRAYAGAEAIACEVMTDEEFDKRQDWTEVPPLASVTEAAEILGVSRQRIQERIADKSIQGVKIGNTWAVVKSTLHSRPPGRPRKNNRRAVPQVESAE